MDSIFNGENGGGGAADPPASHITQLTDCIKIFRRATSFGPDVQVAIARKTELLCDLRQLIRSQENHFHKCGLFCWEFLVNLCVGNGDSRTLVWQHMRDTLYKCLHTHNGRPLELCHMLVYNIYMNGTFSCDGAVLLPLLILNLRADLDAMEKSEFLHFLLEYFFCTEPNIVPMYASLSDEYRCLCLHYIADHISGDQTTERAVSAVMIKYIAKEFKKKSDTVLKTVASYVDEIQPREVCALLEIIAMVSGNEVYGPMLSDDRSLFLNVGCLLQTVTTVGRQAAESGGSSRFTVVSSLAEIATNSTVEAILERDFISYGLKSQLVRTIGNMVYRNRPMQELAREMDIIMAVLDCTSIDARNPCKCGRRTVFLKMDLFLFFYLQ